jgi:hypothetical protein
MSANGDGDDGDGLRVLIETQKRKQLELRNPLLPRVILYWVDPGSCTNCFGTNCIHRCEIFNGLLGKINFPVFSVTAYKVFYDLRNEIPFKLT